METVLVTVEGPERTIDCEVPGDISISDLLPLLMDICAVSKHADSPASPVTWVLGSPTGQPFPSQRSLIACGVVDGARLVLRDQATWTCDSPVVTEAPAPEVSPSSETGGIGVRWNRDGWL